MEAEKENDPFASIIKFCRPTASQEAKFPNCPLVRESENFMDSYQDRFSSSPDPMPPSPTGIVMVSLPGSSSSVQQHVEDEADFHTPPEHHAHSHLSSSEDQNANELCAEGGGKVDGLDRRKKDRDFDVGLDDETEAKKFRVMEENLEGETVPADETEAIEIEGNQAIHDTEVVIIDSEDSGEETATVNLGDDSIDITSRGCMIDAMQKNDELAEVGKPKVDAVNANHELGKRPKVLGDTKVNKEYNENSDLSGSLDTGKIEEEIVEIECIVGNRCIEVEQKSRVGGSVKVVKIIKDAEMPCRNRDLETDGKRSREIGPESDGKKIEENRLKTDDKIIEVIDGETDGKTIEEFGQTDGKEIEEFGQTDGKGIEESGLETNGKKIAEIGAINDGKSSQDIGQKTNGKRIEDIDEFRYTGGDDRRWKRRTGITGADCRRKRQLPVSLKGKEKEVVEGVETKRGLMDFLDVLKAVVGNTDCGCEDVDFLETAKMRGLTFPKPRWWPSSEGGDDERRVS